MKHSGPWRFVALALLVASSGALTAQRRLATAGRVLDANGRPLAGATVTFVGSEPPLGDRFANADRVVEITDDKGRFRAGLLIGSDYSCWTVAAASADGTRATSGVTSGVRAGVGIELCALHVRLPSRARISGTEPWQHLGPLRFEVAVGVAQLHREPLAFVSGVAELPMLPTGAEWFMFVVDRAGNLLHSDRLEPIAGEVTFAVPPPCEIPVRVRDASGAPLADASIHMLISRRLQRGSRKQLLDPPRLAEWRQVGTTGADGTAVVRVLWHEDPFAAKKSAGPLLLAAKRDYVGAVGGWVIGPIVDGGRDTLPEREVLFTLRAAPSWRVRILDKGGAPLPAQAVRLATGMVVHTLQDNVVPEVTFSPRAAEDGWLVFEGLPTELQGSTLLVQAEPASAPTAIERGEARPVPPLVRAPALLTPPINRPFEVDLRTLPEVSVKVMDTTGGPARNADVVMLPLPPEHWQPNDATHSFQLDALGMARTRVEPGLWSVFVTDRVGFAHTTIRITGATDLTLTLQELAVMHGRVLTSREPGSPIEIVVNSSSHGSLTKDEATISLRSMSSRVNGWLAAHTGVAGDGAFALRFLDVPGSKFEGRVYSGDRSANLTLEASVEPVEFDLRR